MLEVGDFPSGTHAQIQGLASKPELNDKHCVCRGPNPDNKERVTVITQTGAQLSLRPGNLRPAELLPGSRVAVVGLTNAAQYNGKFGEVFSYHGDRWIVDLDSDSDKKERKSFRSDNLVIVPEAVASKKRQADEPEVEAKRLKTTDLKDLESADESVVARALGRILVEFPILAQKSVCCLATKQRVTVMSELAAHLTDKQNDGLLRRPLVPGVKVKGIEELDAEDQCQQIVARKTRALAGMVRINYCDLLGFLKLGFKEPKFNRKMPA